MYHNASIIRLQEKKNNFQKVTGSSNRVQQT